MTVKISAMTSASTPLAGTEELELNAGGSTRKTTVADVNTQTFAQLNTRTSDASVARSDASQAFTGNQYTGVTTLSDGASIAIDASANNAFTVTLGGNRTLANATNVSAGMSWVLTVVQDATAGRTLAFGANYSGPGTSADLSSDTNGQKRVFAFYAISASEVVVVDTLGEAI